MAKPATQERPMPVVVRPRLTLVVEFSDMPAFEVLEYSQEIVEKARETGCIIQAKLDGFPSTLDIS